MEWALSTYQIADTRLTGSVQFDDYSTSDDAYTVVVKHVCLYSYMEAIYALKRTTYDPS